MKKNPFSILICALGGEGGGVLTQWLVNTARIAHAPVQSTSIPGVAQRTGATTYYLEFLEPGLVQTKEASPIFSLSPLPGQIDLLISSELLETGRQISNGMTTSSQTCIISASSRVLTTTEKIGLTDSRIPEQTLIELIKQFSKSYHILDMALLAKQSGTVISSVMLGCIGGCGLLPFKKENYETAIKEDSKDLSNTQRASLKGFQLGWEAIEQQIKNTQFVEQVVQSLEPKNEVKNHLSNSPTIAPAVLTQFPHETHDIVKLGYSRLVEYQDPAYADLYIDRLTKILNAEEQANLQQTSKESSTEVGAWAITSETARWTALWMAFDDIVRVAELKNKASRFEGIKQDVKAQNTDIVRVFDHFKPGVPELAGLLPSSMAETLLKWEENRVRSGLPALELKIKLNANSIFGALVLKFLSSLKWLRKMGRRYRIEQLSIDMWLNCVLESTRENKSLGFEVAACGRLIKGYGSTNLRAHENLKYILETLNRENLVNSPLSKAEIVSQARQNALKEESGKSLDVFMRGLGAPQRPLKVQPIRWMKKPSKTAQV